jgi:hypothetical protein
MYYVRWKSSKYHVLNAVNIQISRIGVEINVSPGIGGPPKTQCGIEIPIENNYFEHLPEKENSHDVVCHACSAGIGVPKVDLRAQQMLAEQEKKRSEGKIRQHLQNAARELFD